MEQREQQERATLKGNIRQLSAIDALTTLDYGRFYLSKGFSIIPVIKGTKKPSLPTSHVIAPF